MNENVHNSSPLREPGAFREGVEHFRFGAIYRRMTYLVTVRYGNRHFLYSSNIIFG